MSNKSWNKFSLPEEILKALKENHLDEPLPIQRKALDASLLKNLNILGAAPTGSGKTFAYTIPIVTKILQNLYNPCSKLKARLCKIHKDKEEFELIDDDIEASDDMVIDKVSDNEDQSIESDYLESDDQVEQDYDLDDDVTCPEAIILVPTRELAYQVKEQVDLLCKHTNLKTCCLIGGLSQDKQIRLLEKLKPEIIIGTPGRLYKIVQSDTVQHLNVQSIGSIRSLVIDEADRMIQKGHFEEMLKLIDYIKEFKKFREDNDFRVYLFSATLTFLHELPDRFKIKLLSKKDSRSKGKKGSKKLVDPKDHTKKNKIKQIIDILGIERSETRVIDLNDDSSFGRPKSGQLSEYKISCMNQEKDLYLYYFLKKNQSGRTLVFCNSKDCLRRLTNVLKFLNIKALNLHADMDQKKRLSSLEKFRQSPSSVLIATDVAARGLDIKDLDCVVHYQVPKTCESYIHRSGRTARLNNRGISLTLLEPKEAPYYRRLCNNINSGKDFENYDVDLKLRASLGVRIRLAQQCDKLDHSLREAKTDRNWFLNAAKDCDIELDDDELRRLTKGESQEQYQEDIAKKQRHLSQLQKQLNKMLKRD